MILCFILKLNNPSLNCFINIIRNIYIDLAVHCSCVNFKSENISLLMKSIDKKIVQSFKYLGRLKQLSVADDAWMDFYKIQESFDIEI